jgi:hypothetical protein
MSPALGNAEPAVELLLVDGLDGCECHDVKSCRCIVALKEAASLRSFDIVVNVDPVECVTVVTRPCIRMSHAVLYDFKMAWHSI